MQHTTGSGETQVPFLLPKSRESDRIITNTKKCFGCLTGRIFNERNREKTDAFFAYCNDGPYDDTDRIIFYDHVYGGQDPVNGPRH